MNLRSPNTRLSDITAPESQLTMSDSWNTEAISDLIRSKCDHDETPAFLFLGQKEAGLLTEHLAQVFGEDAVVTLHDTYYMGLDVIVLETESHISTGGRKAVRTLQDPIARRPAWRDLDTAAQWQFRI
jgi:hypothetical protein